jgi:hypothetical protein
MSIALKLNATECELWEAFGIVCRTFLKPKERKMTVKMCSYVFPYIVSMKTHFLLFHKDFFLKTRKPPPMDIAKIFMKTFANGKSKEEKAVQIF